MFFVDNISGEIEEGKIKLVSKIITNTNENEDLKQIINMGERKDIGKGDNNYRKNYEFFCSKVEEFAKSDLIGEGIKLCDTFLNKCVIIPIKCDDEERALTIFSTLNDRGMPLNDTDVFKSQIYKKIGNQEAKNEFIENWKELEKDLKSLNVISIYLRDLFYQYHHKCRAEAKDTKSEISLRKYYKDKNILDNSEDVVKYLREIADFWLAIVSKEDEAKKYSNLISKKSRKYIHILTYYPNDYWKSIIAVYFFFNKKEKVSFKEDFEIFLRNISAYLYSIYVIKPNVSTIKQPLFREMKCIAHNETLELGAVKDEDIIEETKRRLPNASSRITKGLLLLHAYLHESQTEIIPYNKLEIEHILPRKWQNTNYLNWNRKDADEYLNKWGNLVILDKETNIQAGNGYFGLKKERYYKKTEIAQVKEFAEKYPENDWGKEQIEAREQEFITDIMAFFSGKKEIN